uniref:Uncharacterized protein n=1 Tax=Spironucleus salmonicida TaxID=348837 RepID=V6LRN7_9EUKA|eukprot:EST46361.1 Hypothetical protein SS50377_13604 [Spironucleus salmonicida]
MSTGLHLLRALRHRDFALAPEALAPLFSPFADFHAPPRSSAALEDLLARVFALRLAPDEREARALVQEADPLAAQLQMLRSFPAVLALARQRQVFQLVLVFKSAHFTGSEVGAEVLGMALANAGYFRARELAALAGKVDGARLSLQHKVALAAVDDTMLLELVGAGQLAPEHLTTDQLCAAVPAIPTGALCACIGQRHLSARHILQLGEALPENGLVLEFLCFTALRAGSFSAVLARDGDDNAAFYAELERLPTVPERMQFLGQSESGWLHATGLMLVYYRELAEGRATSAVAVARELRVLFAEVPGMRLAEMFCLVEFGEVLDPGLASPEFAALVCPLLNRPARCLLAAQADVSTAAAVVCLDCEVLVALDGPRVGEIARHLGAEGSDLLALCTLYPYADQALVQQTVEQRGVLHQLTTAERDAFEFASGLLPDRGRLAALASLLDAMHHPTPCDFDDIYMALLAADELVGGLGFRALALSAAALERYFGGLTAALRQNVLYRYFSTELMLFVPAFLPVSGLSRHQVAEVLAYRYWAAQEE